MPLKLTQNVMHAHLGQLLLGRNSRVYIARFSLEIFGFIHFLEACAERYAYTPQAAPERDPEHARTSACTLTSIQNKKYKKRTANNKQRTLRRAKNKNKIKAPIFPGRHVD